MPARVPESIVARLNKAVVELMAMPETRKHFLAIGWTPVTSTPAELGAYIRSEIKRWAAVVEAAGATVD